MNNLTIVVDHPAMAMLAWTLLHFVWQGALLGLLPWAASRQTRLRSSSRYGIGVLTMALMLATAVVTFMVLNASTPPATSSAVATTQYSSWFVNPADGGTAVGDISWLLLVPVLWSAGVAGLSLRLAYSWIAARRLVSRSAQTASPQIQTLTRRLADRLALGKAVAVFQSRSVSVPVLIGWLKPVILLPTSALSGLTPVHIEALIAHELAHVRRHDYLVNLIQSAIETLFFYHPVVWWVSRNVRDERERCCDDIAVSVCDRLEYAGALANLAALTTVPQPMLAASGRGGLFGRVERLLNPGEAGHRVTRGWAGGILVVALGASALVPLFLFSVGIPSASASSLPTPVADLRSKHTEARDARPIVKTAVATTPVKRTPQRPTRVPPDLAAAQAQVDRARAELEDIQRLAERGIASQSELDKRIDAVAAAERQLAMVRDGTLRPLSIDELRQRPPVTPSGRAIDRAGSSVPVGTGRPQPRPAPQPSGDQSDLLRPPGLGPLAEGDTLRAGDTLHIKVGADRQAGIVSGRVGVDGLVDLPLLGQVNVRNLTAGETRNLVTRLLRERLQSTAPVDVTITRSGAARRTPGPR